mmetsp:Transcript_52379/g.98291  ORF Transcript_52379/g.98291 Transcript_52379/m.98291 type:complete len:261 (+) Transcript_52379:116-898(+)
MGMHPCETADASVESHSPCVAATTVAALCHQVAAAQEAVAQFPKVRHNQSTVPPPLFAIFAKRSNHQVTAAISRTATITCPAIASHLQEAGPCRPQFSKKKAMASWASVHARPRASSVVNSMGIPYTRTLDVPRHMFGSFEVSIIQCLSRPRCANLMTAKVLLLNVAVRTVVAMARPSPSALKTTLNAACTESVSTSSTSCFAAAQRCAVLSCSSAAEPRTSSLGVFGFASKDEAACGSSACMRFWPAQVLMGSAARLPL